MRTVAGSLAPWAFSAMSETVSSPAGTGTSTRPVDPPAGGLLAGLAQGEAAVHQRHHVAHRVGGLGLEADDHVAAVDGREVGRVGDVDDRGQVLRHRLLRGFGPARLPVGAGERLAHVQLVEDQRHHVGPVEAVAEARGGVELGRLVPAAVHLPADQVLAAGRGHVVALGRPGHPALAVRVGVEGEQLRAVAEPVPADRAVAVGRHDQPPVAAHVHRPGGAGHGPPPQLLAGLVEQAQRPVGAEHEAPPVRRHGEAAGALVGLERQPPAVQARLGAVLPALDREAGRRGPRGGEAGGAPARVQPALRQREQGRRLAPCSYPKPSRAPSAETARTSRWSRKSAVAGPTLQAGWPSAPSSPSRGSAAAKASRPPGSPRRAMTVSWLSGRSTGAPRPPSGQRRRRRSPPSCHRPAA